MARRVVGEAMRSYYDQRAAEYDDWWLGRGVFAGRPRPGWSGEVVALDQSEAMGTAASERLPDVRVIQGDAVPLPFADGEFERVFTGHFYGHLLPDEREPFLQEARRVGRELVVVDSARHEDVPAEEHQQRLLNDGSRHTVYKRFFEPDELVAELGGGAVLHSGRWFVAVAS